MLPMFWCTCAPLDSACCNEYRSRYLLTDSSCPAYPSRHNDAREHEDLLCLPVNTMHMLMWCQLQAKCNSNCSSMHGHASRALFGLWRPQCNSNHLQAVHSNSGHSSSCTGSCPDSAGQASWQKTGSAAAEPWPAAHLAIAQAGYVLPLHVQTQGNNEAGNLIVLEQGCIIRSLHIQNLAAQGQNGLKAPVPGLLCTATCSKHPWR